jgi:hypothetical protein
MGLGSAVPRTPLGLARGLWDPPSDLECPVNSISSVPSPLADFSSGPLVLIPPGSPSIFLLAMAALAESWGSDLLEEMGGWVGPTSSSIPGEVPEEAPRRPPEVTEPRSASPG